MKQGLKKVSVIGLILVSSAFLFQNCSQHGFKAVGVVESKIDVASSETQQSSVNSEQTDAQNLEVSSQSASTENVSADRYPSSSDVQTSPAQDANSGSSSISNTNDATRASTAAAASQPVAATLPFTNLSNVHIAGNFPVPDASRSSFVLSNRIQISGLPPSGAHIRMTELQGPESQNTVQFAYSINDDMNWYTASRKHISPNDVIKNGDTLQLECFRSRYFGTTLSVEMELTSVDSDADVLARGIWSVSTMAEPDIIPSLGFFSNTNVNASESGPFLSGATTVRGLDEGVNVPFYWNGAGNGVSVVLNGIQYKSHSLPSYPYVLSIKNGDQIQFRYDKSGSVASGTYVRSSLIIEPFGSNPAKPAQFIGWSLGLH